MSQRAGRTPRVMARGVGRLLLFAAIILGTLVPMTSSSAATTICVALTVDFTSLNGGVDSACTRVPKGANGYQVLAAGHHTYTICNNGIIGEIDNQPANGCQVKDSTHFWGYWHRKPGSRTWTFSNLGAGGYHPVEGSTEGWVWEDGTTSPPADTPYPAGCHTPPASPSPSPTPRPSAHSSPPTSTAGGASQGGATSTAGSASPTGETTTSGRARHRASASATAAPDVPSTKSASATPSADTSTPSPTSTAHVLAGDPPDTSNGGGHLAPLAAALALAALLGAGAWWRSRRTGGSP